MNIKIIENEYDVEIIYNDLEDKNRIWKYVAYHFDECSGYNDDVAFGDTLEELVRSLEIWINEKDFSDDDWARSIDYGGYDTADEFWDHIYKF